MKRRYILSKPAERDLDQIKAYLVKEAGIAIARKVLRDLRMGMQLLGTRPGAGHSREDLTDELLKFWPVYSYLIIYDPARKPIEIVRVVHGARDVETLLG